MTVKRAAWQGMWLTSDGEAHGVAGQLPVSELADPRLIQHDLQQDRVRAQVLDVLCNRASTECQRGINGVSTGHQRSVNGASKASSQGGSGELMKHQRGISETSVGC